jgi:hypothetical protein
MPPLAALKPFGWRLPTYYPIKQAVNDSDKEPTQGHGCLDYPRGPHIEAFNRSPALADPSLIIIKAHEKPASWSNSSGYEIERLPHVSSMVQYTPGIDDIELTKGVQKHFAQGVTLHDVPTPEGTELLFDTTSTGNALRIVIEGYNLFRAELAGRQGE